MEDQDNINRDGPLIMQSIINIHAKNFHSNTRQCQHLLFGQRDKEFSTDNKTQDIRYSCPLFKCQPLTWDTGSPVATLAGAGTLRSALRAQVWKLCFWRVPATDFLLWVLLKRGHWIHKQQDKGRDKMAYLVWQARGCTDSQSTQNLLTISRITWEGSEEWGFCGGTEYATYFLAYECDLGLHRDM